MLALGCPCALGALLGGGAGAPSGGAGDRRSSRRCRPASASWPKRSGRPW
ncbi:MAG: hypothetical protein MZU91_04775 [Desulfosudis oleivorans]|nr:hypothetical protein [Desulfosudis oleivorans]